MLLVHCLVRTEVRKELLLSEVEVLAVINAVMNVQLVVTRSIAVVREVILNANGSELSIQVNARSYAAHKYRHWSTICMKFSA